MLNLTNILYNFSINIFSFVAAATVAYFLTLRLLDALVEGVAMFLFGTVMSGFVVVTQLESFLN